MDWNIALLVVTFATFVVQINGKVQVSFKLKHYENTNHDELDGGCCDFGCGSCDNRFNLCFDNYGGNNLMTDCAYGSYNTDRLYENNDNFNFPASLSDSVNNPIILTINSWSTGFRSKIEVWDYDPSNADDKIDYYGYNFNFSPDRSSATATTHTVTLNGAGSSLTTVEVKVYCAQHYYGTSSGCNRYCLATDNNLGHYDCNDVTGDRMCHAGWTGDYCNVEINECSSNPCKNGGQCFDLLANYRCECVAGTEGKNCDDMNECVSNPCDHGGTCRNLLNFYECDCPRRYSGVRCQYEVDFCDSIPCQNGGTCLGENDNSVLECECAPGYGGEFCGTDIDECSGVNCLNNGACVDGIASFQCNCTKGYSGTYCEMDFRDECASNPCQNNASCVDEVDRYVCLCPSGFQSDNCEENVDECELLNPCSNGNCSDLINDYTCSCVAGYTGKNCTDDIDECVDNQCQHNSTCQDGVSGYTCSCLPGYEGVFCEGDVDECLSMPCKNGGTCDDSLAIDDFHCHCSSTGYYGQLCEEDDDECERADACSPDEMCINLNGSFECQEIVSTTPLPGLCRSQVCYNDGTCTIVNNTYTCICTGDFTGDLCETPTELCSPSPCMNGGYCQVNTAENGSVYYSCQCAQDYLGVNCTLYVGRQVGGTQGGFTNWYFILVALLLIFIIVLGGMFFYRVIRDKRNKKADEEPTVFANPHTESIRIPASFGAVAAPPLPPKDKLGEVDMSMTFANNLYSDIDGPEVRRGAMALPSRPHPNGKFDDEDPYAIGGYIKMGNGHAASPPDESHYEFAPDLPVTAPRPVQENDYSTEPTLSSSVRNPFGIDSAYSTTIVIDKDRPVSKAIPPPLPERDSFKGAAAAIASDQVAAHPVASTPPAGNTEDNPYMRPRSIAGPSSASAEDNDYSHPKPTADTPPAGAEDNPYSHPRPTLRMEDEGPSSPTSVTSTTSPGNPFSAGSVSMDGQIDEPSTPSSVPSTPSSPSNDPYSTTIFSGNKQGQSDI